MWRIWKEIQGPIGPQSLQWLVLVGHIYFKFLRWFQGAAKFKTLMRPQGSSWGGTQKLSLCHNPCGLLSGGAILFITIVIGMDLLHELLTIAYR
jgi:hypothetical protein